MKKSLRLTNEQTRTLYNLLSNHQVPNRSDNRKRWRFLEVLEDVVDKFDDKMKALAGKKIEDVKDREKFKDKVDKLSEKTHTFIFNDREIFARVKDMFEKLFNVGTVSRDQMGKMERNPLSGRDAKVYMELEDAFADVKEIKEPKKEK